MPIMNSIGYLKIKKVFTQFLLRKAVSGIYRDFFDICEKEDGTILAIWGKTTDAANTMDFYVCDGANISDVFNTENSMETSPKTSKIFTLTGDWTGIQKPFSIFADRGKSYIVLKEAGRYSPAKAAIIHVYCKPYGGNWADIFSQVLGTPSSIYGSYNGTCVNGFAKHEGTYFVPFSESTGTAAKLCQVYSLDSGNSWNYKDTSIEMTNINWGSLTPSGKYFQTIYAHDRFILTMQQSSIGNEFYALESLDGIDWTNNLITSGDITTLNACDTVNFDIIDDFIYMNVPFHQKTYRKMALGTTSANFLDKNSYEEVENLGNLNFNNGRYEMHWLSKSYYLITAYSHWDTNNTNNNNNYDAMIHFRY